MIEWKNPQEELPADGEYVEIGLPGGRRVKPVEYAAGRFWKVRKGHGGHAYEPEVWRPLSSKQQGGKPGERKEADDAATSTAGTD